MPSDLPIISVVFAWYSFSGSDSGSIYPATPVLEFLTYSNFFPITSLLAPGMVLECDHSSLSIHFYHFIFHPLCTFSSNFALIFFHLHFCIHFLMPELLAYPRDHIQFVPSCCSNILYLIKFLTFQSQKFCFENVNVLSIH